MYTIYSPLNMMHTRWLSVHFSNKCWALVPADAYGICLIFKEYALFFLVLLSKVHIESVLSIL